MVIKAVSQLPWSHKGREEWFSLGENHERRRGFPGFPAKPLWRLKRCCAETSHQVYWAWLEVKWLQNTGVIFSNYVLPLSRL